MLKAKLRESGLSEWEAEVAYSKIKESEVDEDSIERFEVERTYGDYRMDINVRAVLKICHVSIKATIETTEEDDEREART